MLLQYPEAVVNTELACLAQRVSEPLLTFYHRPQVYNRGCAPMHPRQEDATSDAADASLRTSVARLAVMQSSVQIHRYFLLGTAPTERSL